MVLPQSGVPGAPSCCVAALLPLCPPRLSFSVRRLPIRFPVVRLPARGRLLGVSSSAFEHPAPECCILVPTPASILQIRPTRRDHPDALSAASVELRMRMPDLPKRLKRLLREQVSLAHEEELRRALLPLADGFDRWRRGEISSGELSERIHDFHQGPVREIWKAYNYGSPTLAVAYAIRQGILQRENVPPELLEALGPSLDFYECQDADAPEEVLTEE